MNFLPSSDISLAPSPAARRLGDILDILVAIRIDAGRSANGVAASPTLLPEQMTEVRLLLARAIASTKEVLDSILWSDDSNEMDFCQQYQATPPRMAAVGQIPS